MTKPVLIPDDHPRAKSLRIRERIIEGFGQGIVATSGLIAHGRGEAFDYLLGEETTKASSRAVEAAAAVLLMAKEPVISVNGNAAVLVAEDLIRLATVLHAKIEVNLFYRSREREILIEKLLKKAGARKIYGVGKNACARIPELNSERRRVDPQGIMRADAVLVPLEDGDRTEALVDMGKRVIAIDLNPLSRTARKATITIVDNIIRAAPNLTEMAQKLQTEGEEKCRQIVETFDNQKNLAESIAIIEKRLSTIAKRR